MLRNEGYRKCHTSSTSYESRQWNKDISNKGSKYLPLRNPCWENFQKHLRKKDLGTSLVVLWLRLHAPKAGFLGSIPGQRTRSHKPQLRVCMPQLVQTSCSRKNKYFFKKREKKKDLEPRRKKQDPRKQWEAEQLGHKWASVNNQCPGYKCMKWSESCSLVSNSLWPPWTTVHGILQTRILEWVAVPILQGIFPTQRSNPGLLHCRKILLFIYLFIYLSF